MLETFSSKQSLHFSECPFLLFFCFQRQGIELVIKMET